MIELQHAFMVSASTEEEKVSDVSCSPACSAKHKHDREQIDLLIRDIEDIKYDGYTLRKAQKPIREKLEAQTKDYKRVKDELYDLKQTYAMAQYNINRLTAELAASNARGC